MINFVMSRLCIYGFLLILITEKTFARVELKGTVFKDSFKMKHLATFKVELCIEINHLDKVHPSVLLR